MAPNRRRSGTRPYRRSVRVAELVREIIADELRLIDDERLELVSITGVQVDSEFRTGVVYFDTAFGDGADDAVIIEALDEHLVKELSQLAPFGRDNARPCVVVRNVELSGPPTFLGKDQKNLALQLKCGTTFMRAIWWRSGEHFEKLKRGMRVDIVLSPKLNTFRGSTDVEPEVHDLRIHDSA